MIPDPANAPIRDAATIIVLDRDTGSGPAVLMGQRGAKAAFMPSKYVFPGGAVDPEDGAVALHPGLDAQQQRLLAADPLTPASATPSALAAAALRELAEETGLMTGNSGCAPTGWLPYERAGLAPDPSHLLPVFRAITPPGGTRRFDARFFMLDAAKLHGDRHDFSWASDELSHLHWVSLEEARDLDLPFITEVVLAEITTLARRAGPLRGPDAVPFFDNRSDRPRFGWIA